VHAHRHRLDHGRPLVGEGALAGLVGGLEHRLDVVAVDGYTDEAVTGRALHGIDRELLVERRGVRVLVVLEYEDHGQSLHPGPVHGLVEVAPGGRPVPEPGQRDPPLAAELEGHRHPGGDKHHVGQHRNHSDASDPPVAEVHVSVSSAGDARVASHVLRQDPRRRHAADQVGGEVAVQHAQPILRCHRERCARGHRLLAEAVVERTGDLPLAVEAHRAFLEAAHQEHRPQQPDPILDLEVPYRAAFLGGRLSRIGCHLCSLSSLRYQRDLH
jgi:hypothetical protein